MKTIVDCEFFGKKSHKVFNTWEQALTWIEILKDNQVWFDVSFEH